MKLQKGFTLIELMVVIVIIGILSALAIPKMFGVSAKAKAAEAPGVISNFETLQSAYSQETGKTGFTTEIGFVLPGTVVGAVGSTKWFQYTITPAAVGAGATTATIVSKVNSAFGNCALTDSWTSGFDAGKDCYAHGSAAYPNASCAGAPAGALPATAGCAAYSPNW